MCVWPRSLPVRTAKVFNMGEERRRTAFRSASTSGASPGLEDDGVTLMYCFTLHVSRHDKSVSYVACTRSRPCHWLSLLAVWPVTSLPDSSVNKEEEMFLYLDCGRSISRIYSRSNTRITSRWSVTSRYTHTFSVFTHNSQMHYVIHYKLSLKGQAIPATQQL